MKPKLKIPATRVLSDECVIVIGRVIELEQPYDRPDVLESLSADELLWLINATGVQEMAEERKKDYTVSESTS